MSEKVFKEKIRKSFVYGNFKYNKWQLETQKHLPEQSEYKIPIVRLMGEIARADRTKVSYNNKSRGVETA